MFSRCHRAKPALLPGPLPASPCAPRHSVSRPQQRTNCWLPIAGAAAQGEDQKKLDVISNDIFCNVLRSTGRTGTIASEEEDLPVPVSVEETASGNYVVVFDPLDGSSNIDAGISVGSIFGARCHASLAIARLGALQPQRTVRQIWGQG